MLLGAPGLTTRSKDATRGSWHRYYRSILTTSNKKHAFNSMATPTKLRNLALCMSGPLSLERSSKASCMC